MSDLGFALLHIVNMTTTDSDSDSTDGHQDHHSRTLNYGIISFVIAWLILSLCIIGIVGNTLSIIVYCHPSMRQAINILLAGLSAIDLCLSILAIPTFVVPGLSAYYGSVLLKNAVSYISVYFYPFCLTMQSASVWTFVLITLERWQTVGRRSNMIRLSTVERARTALLIVCVLAMAYNAVRFFEFRLVHEETTDPASTEGSDTGLGSVGVSDSGPAPSTQDHHQTKIVGVSAVLRNSTLHPSYMSIYYIGMFLVSHFIFPFFILAILNALIVSTICRSRQRRMSLNRRERSEHRTASMIIIVVVTFILCYLLHISLNVIEAVDPEFFYGRNMVVAFALNDISNFLVMLNASTSIVVYWLFSAKYRFVLITLLIRVFPCLRGCASVNAVLRRQSTTDAPALDETGLNRKLSATAGIHALFMVVARTAESKRSFLMRRRSTGANVNGGVTSGTAAKKKSSVTVFRRRDGESPRGETRDCMV